VSGAPEAAPPWVRWALGACVLLGLALRGIEAREKSLWLDEYHTLFLADSDGLGEIVAKGASDVHPPAFFWALSLLRDVAPHAQRLFPILLSLLTLIPLWSIARHGGLGSLARLCLCGLFLFAPYQIQYGAELRSYSALQLLSVVLVWAAVTSSTRAWVRIGVFGLATALGLYVHYFVAVAVLSVGLARCFTRPPGSASLRALVIAGTVGVVLFLPWVVAQEEWLLRDPGEVLEWAGVPPRALPSVWSRNLRQVAALPARTLVPMIGGLGAPCAGPMRIAVTLLLAAAGVGIAHVAWRLWKRTLPPGSGAVGSALLAGALGFVAVTALCLGVWKRVPLQYFAVAAWAWPMLLGFGVQCVSGARLARLTTALVLLAGLTAGACHALGASREDTEAGVVAAVQAGRDRNALYTAVLWQPDWYPHALPFRYRAPGVHDADMDVREPAEIPPGDAPGGERDVIVVTRRTEPERHAFRELWVPILQGRHLAETLQIDAVTRVYVFESP
jgi:hypothetical protein